MEISPSQKAKLQSLKDLLTSWGCCAIAYSGGVDSTFLLAVAHETLGEKCLAVIATSSTYPKREYLPAIEWLKKNGIRYERIISEELDIPEFRDNPPQRCYFCKKELFIKVRNISEKHGIKVIADGANLDDAGDFRPGMQAAKELDVKSPLKELGFSKEDIRQLSSAVYNLPTAFRQAMACMASRIPYGSPITPEKLRQVEEVEDFLAAKGFKTFRARHHGDVLRIELAGEDMPSAVQNAAEIVIAAKKAGFIYVTLDLEGFRSGSMNEILNRE
ncbi:MAG TPA: ATP-dependent sacrificial sulfur transferase LarE [Desulfomonilia bacterium]